MNLKQEHILLFFMMVVDVYRLVSSFDSKCPPLTLFGGRSRYRWRGRSVRFNCMRGFQLVGVKYAICMNGKWDAEVPICVKYGCRAPSTSHVNGQFIESYRGAVVKIVCNPGYTLVGSPSVYCNGIRWNETFPVCRVKNTNPALSCDFETPDLCGWSQDPMHDFDWKRQNGSTPSGDVGTGPMYDHTRGENNTGYYMYMESSSPRMENDTARLYSPVYPPEYSNGTCFKFWYHMYGATTGFLKVYVKPEGVELYNLIPSFWINGEQGKSWIESFFPIERMETPFQIVIEGVRGAGAVGDTAFDDVKLTSSEECKILEAMTSTTEFSYSTTPDEDISEFFSCKNRCNEEITNRTDYDKCHCYETCDRDGSCCSDYFELCSDFAPTATTAQTDLTSTSSFSSSTVSEKAEEKQTSVQIPLKSSTQPVSKSSTVSTPPIHYNNESNEIIPRKPIFLSPPPPIQPIYYFNRTINKIPKEIPTTAKTTTSTTTPKPESKPVFINKTEIKSTAVVNTTKTFQRKISKVVDKKLIKPGTNRTKVDKTIRKDSPEIETKTNGTRKSFGKAEVVKSTTVTSLISTSTGRSFKNSKPNNIKLTMMEKPSNPNLLNEGRFNRGKSKEGSAGKELPQAIKINKSDKSEGSQIRGIVEFCVTAVAVLVIIILGVIWYRRRETRKTERENMVEDSDVRFLTSDEALDFTLARPADDDL